jgi:mannitol/fructose-specific phosphotransferase system IIA component (Ntr-type)
MAYRQLTLEQAAALLHCPERFLREQATQGGLPHLWQGENLLFNQEELLNWSSIHLLENRKSKQKGQILSEEDPRHERILPGDYCTLTGISAQLKGKSKASILMSLTELAEKTGLLYDSSDFYESLRRREEQASTALSGGVALVHPNSRDEFLFEDSFVCIAKSQYPIFFGEENGRTSDLFFVVACKDDLHIHVLGTLGRLIMETSLLEDLRQAENAKEMLSALYKAEGNPAWKPE